MVIWVIKIFFFNSSVCSCHLFLIPSISVRSIPFLSFIVSIFAWNVPLVSLILLKRFLVFSILLFSLFLCIDHWRSLSYLSLLFFGTLYSCGYIFSFSTCLLLHFSAICKAFSDNHLAFFAFLFLGGWFWSLPPIQCHEPLSIALQALYQI